MNKQLAAILNIDSTETLVEELYKILYNSYTNYGVSGIIPKVTVKRSLQNLEDYFECNILQNSNVYYVFIKDSLRQLVPVDSLDLVNDMVISRLNSYKSFQYLSLNENTEPVLHNGYIHSSLDPQDIYQRVSLTNSVNIIKALAKMIEDNQDQPIACRQSAYKAFVENINNYFTAQGMSACLDSGILTANLQDFESTVGKSFIDLVNQYNLDQQAKLDAVEAHRKNIIALWKLFLLFFVPALLLYNLFK